LKRLRHEFDQAERARHMDILYPFCHRVWVCARLLIPSSGIQLIQSSSMESRRCERK
jgi:hypothetical protein